MFVSWLLAVWVSIGFAHLAAPGQRAQHAAVTQTRITFGNLKYGAYAGRARPFMLEFPMVVSGPAGHIGNMMELQTIPGV